MIVLQEYAIESHPLTTVVLPGTPCLAQFSLDHVWYRAVVTSKASNNIYVILLDGCHGYQI